MVEVLKNPMKKLETIYMWKKRVVYKRVKGKPTRKVYMKYKGKFCQVKKFVAAMIAAGKWKPIATKKKSPKPCKSGKVRNPKTLRCIKAK